MFKFALKYIRPSVTSRNTHVTSRFLSERHEVFFCPPGYTYLRDKKHSGITYRKWSTTPISKILGNFAESFRRSKYLPTFAGILSVHTYTNI